jgi:hypothetical protein
VHKQAFAALTLGLGLLVAIGSASCGETCPPENPNCGNANPSSGDAGATGSEQPKCDLLTALRSCMDAFCKTASNPFCTCYKRGFDLTTDGCKCIDFDAKTFCDRAEANAIDAKTYDCAAASSGVSSYCVPVN